MLPCHTAHPILLVSKQIYKVQSTDYGVLRIGPHIVNHFMHSLTDNIPALQPQLHKSQPCADSRADMRIMFCIQPSQFQPLEVSFFRSAVLVLHAVCKPVQWYGVDGVNNRYKAVVCFPCFVSRGLVTFAWLCNRVLDTVLIMNASLVVSIYICVLYICIGQPCIKPIDSLLLAVPMFPAQASSGRCCLNHESLVYKLLIYICRIYKPSATYIGGIPPRTTCAQQ